MGLGGDLGMAQEGGIDAGIAQRQGLAIHPHRTVLQRADQILGGVHQLEQVAAMVPALAAGGGDEDLQRRVAGPRPHAGQRGVDPGRAVLHGDDGIGHAQRQIVMGVDAALGFRVEHAVEGLQTRRHAVHVERAAAIHHIDALRAIALHQPGLGSQGFGLAHMRHHQETDRIHAHFAGQRDMLGGDVGLGAMGGDAHRAHAEIVGALEILLGADARQQQGGEAGAGQLLGDGGDPFLVGVGAEAVIEAGPRQAVAMRDLDRIDPGRIEGARDGAYRIQPVLMADGVHAVAQGDILDIELLHAATPSASFSAVARAAEVMMSRLPE